MAAKVNTNSSTGNVNPVNGKMALYAWTDPDSKSAEVKFGEHFVHGNDLTFEQLEESTLNYLKSVFPRRAGAYKKMIEEGLVYVWDASTAAFEVGRNKIGGHMDDYVRPTVGARGTLGKEFHAVNFDTVVDRVCRWLTDAGQELFSAELSSAQYDMAEIAVCKFNDGTKVLLAELCARFGKTIWSAAVATEMDAEVIIVASYQLSVHTSFKNDLRRFEQFADLVHIDTKDDNWEERLTEARRNNQRVIVYLSLCNGPKRQERIDFLSNLNDRTMMIIDEADFGAHTENQALPMIAASETMDHVIIMTGTNSDRAATYWTNLSMISVTYPEMLNYKREALEAGASL